MIDASIGGKLFAKPFVTGKVRVATQGDESIFVSVIAFDAPVITTLMALDAGDGVALSGALTPKV